MSELEGRAEFLPPPGLVRVRCSVADRGAVLEAAGSRAATDALLALLRGGGWRPTAWMRFLVLAAERSWQEAARRPTAVAKISLLHGALLAAGRGRSRWWVATSWALAVSHLGLLEDRRSLGAAKALTLARANLPVAGARLGRWIGLVAIASDLADGALARRLGTVTPFGEYADSLADAAFWTWLTVRGEPSRVVRVAALVAWAVPVVAVAAGSLARGRMVDRPRPVVLRPAAAMQALIAVRRAVRP
ncbi:CDP-alcohol phosphatidyltransferase family protein [Streptomyces sp. NPDC006984]|uniref:CDP-alcohol phosphatidyltransferase family protein n=1 Tax=Streptomyces sp. NPDC006984 TaxID=3155463 RepID=UPI00340900D9